MLNKAVLTILLLNLFSCAYWVQQEGKHGVFLLQIPKEESSAKKSIIRFNKIVITGYSCSGFGGNYDLAIHAGLEEFHKKYPDTAIGLYDVTVESYMNFILPCIRITGYPLIFNKAGVNNEEDRRFHQLILSYENGNNLLASSLLDLFNHDYPNGYYACQAKKMQADIHAQSVINKHTLTAYREALAQCERQDDNKRKQEIVQKILNIEKKLKIPLN